MSRWTSSDMEEPAAGCARVDLRRYLEEKYVRKRWTGSVDEQPTKVPTRQVPQVQPQPPQHAAAAPTSRPSIVRAPAITPQAQTRPAAHPTDKPKLQINMNRTVTQKPAAPAPLAPPTASLGSLRIGPPPGRQKLVPQPRQEASLKAQAPVTAADVIGSSSPNPFAQQSQAESLAPQASQTHVQNEPLEALDMFAEQAQAAPSTSQLQQPPQSNLFAAAPPQEDLFAVPSTKGDTFAIASPHVQPSDLSVTQQEQPLALASTDPFEAPITAAAPSTNPFAQPSPVGTNPFGKPNGGQAQAAALGPAQPVATPPMTPNVVISGAHQRQHFASPPPANTSQLAMTPRMPISMAGPSLTEGAAVMEEAANAAQFTTNEVALLDVGTKLEKIVVLSTYQGHATIRGKHDATREVDGTKLIKLAPNPTFSQNEDALYEIGGRIERCKIAEVHQDAPDEPPYYTIRLANSGRERTTDSPHLLKPFAVPGVASARGREADDDPFSDLGSGLPSTDSPASDTFGECFRTLPTIYDGILKRSYRRARHVYCQGFAGPGTCGHRRSSLRRGISALLHNSPTCELDNSACLNLTNPHRSLQMLSVRLTLGVSPGRLRLYCNSNRRLCLPSLLTNRRWVLCKHGPNRMSR